MPWTVKDVDRFKKGLSDEQKKKWVKIANSALASCQRTGGRDCDGYAIRVANSKVGTHMDDYNVVSFKLSAKDFRDIETEDVDDGLIIKGIPVFKAGTHRGKKFDEKYIDDKLIGNFKPEDNIPVQADHSDSWEKTLGYVRSLVRKGKMLYADLELRADNAIARWKKGLMKK